MASILGAGKKEADNTFTGLLLGDLPEVEDNTTKTGLVGYEHGEQAYGIFDDGTMFLGKASRAQLKFDGTDGYIKNTGYDYGEGIKIDFDGGVSGDKIVNTTTAQTQKPYIDMISSTGAEVYISPDGEAHPYFQIKGEDEGKVDSLLMYISKDDYYLQDNERAHGRPGLKINLKTGEFDSTGQLTITGDSNSSINFGSGNFAVDGDGVLTISELNIHGKNGDDEYSVSGIIPKWMTFVTDVEGAILKGTTPVSMTVNVSGTTPYTYEYPTTNTVTLTGTETVLIQHPTGAAEIAKPLNGDLGTQLSVNMKRGDWFIVPDSTSTHGSMEETGYRRTITLEDVVASKGVATKNVQVAYSGSGTGSTDIPVVQGIKLRITKISMWALTNDTSVSTTNEIPVYEADSSGHNPNYDNF